jgi:hypothetical protein
MEVTTMARDYIPLQVRFYDEYLLARVKEIAINENRSMNAQILEFLKQGIEKYSSVSSVINNTPTSES